MRRLLLTLALAAAALAALIASVPPAPLTLAPPDEVAGPVRGSVHVHTRRSDGSGTVEQVAAAAARAGLDFVVLADHGDATRRPERPVYIDGVLCIDAVEISTAHGHLLTLGLAEPAPYPLGGEARDVVEDVKRLGGMAIAAHPGSAKADLRWTDWDTPVDGLEWLNADSEWRDEGPVSLARAVFGYLWRPPQALATMLDRPADTLRQWDAMTTARRVVALASADAHANLGFDGTSHRYGDRALLAMPAYEELFRTFSVTLPGLKLSGNADADAGAVVQEIRSGRLYSTVDAFAAPGRLVFAASSGRHTASIGEVLRLGGPVIIRVETNAPEGARVRLLKDGTVVASGDGPELDYTASPERGAYRVEVDLAGAAAGTAPWLLSNPVYAGGFPSVPPPPRGRSSSVPASAQGLGTDVWRIEKNDASRGVLEFVPLLDGTRRRLRYALGGAETDDVFVALALRIGSDLADFDGVVVRAGAGAPMRVWLQLWMPVATGNRYWRRSLYVDRTVREIAVPFGDFTPVDDAPADIPLSAIASILFVIERTHTPLGTGGQLWVDDVRLMR